MTPQILRTVLVDDEAPAREYLSDLLFHHPRVKIVGEADGVRSAAELCRDLSPDLIFLDVQMPDGNGFSLLPKLSPLPAIIFVTAFDDFAIRAFEINAIDYLLKPVRPDRLANALERVIHAQPRVAKERFRESDQIVLESKNRASVVFVSQISAIVADENYTHVFLADSTTEHIRRTMTQWEALLPETLFLRCERSVMVNLKAIQRMMNLGRTACVEVAGKAEPIVMGRTAAERLRKTIRQRGYL